MYSSRDDQWLAFGLSPVPGHFRCSSFVYAVRQCACIWFVVCCATLHLSEILLLYTCVWDWAQRNQCLLGQLPVAATIRSTKTGNMIVSRSVLRNRVTSQHRVVSLPGKWLFPASTNCRGRTYKKHYSPALYMVIPQEETIGFWHSPQCPSTLIRDPSPSSMKF